MTTVVMMITVTTVNVQNSDYMTQSEKQSDKTNILAEILLSSKTTSAGLFMTMETPNWTPATVQLDKRADPCVLNPKPLRPPEIRVLIT